MQNRPLPTQGSSPRMRGTRRAGACGSDRPGIIPAYAGNTASRACSSGTERDHPRVCGEHPEIRLLHGARLGSSPRMRGTHDWFGQHEVFEGIIPAYAGNTTPTIARTSPEWDHPRVCGEHYVLEVARIVRPGSSPRMRGTLTVKTRKKNPDRIIPAYAGNTTRLLWRPRAFRDHPRVCGEHGAVREPICRKTGSSPRMRGTLCRLFQSIYYTGIIPAYAGNTDLHARDVMHVRDYPRVCGEHLISCTFPRNASGSSPRMRGTRRFRKASTPNNGIIPAYAGNTAVQFVKPFLLWDHPRVCGEHSASCMVRWLPRGSSPRMRGTRS